ncbi:MAG: riboflavin synthase [Bacteroidota bacterium]
MFTGIIEEKGVVRLVRHGAKSSELIIGAKKALEEIKIGDSISVNGICLTVTGFGHDYFTVDVMPETIRQTSLSGLKTGSAVNLERALRLSDRLGGHLVSGHIDGAGKVSKVWQEDNAMWINITADQSILKYIVKRGSVAVDGVSLTVPSVNDYSFSVSVIPHTKQATTLTDKKTGDLVNIECDVIAKYIEKLSTGNESASNIDLDFLKKNDFYE